MKTPEHLGGHCNRTWVDSSTLRFIQNEFNISSMLDIGCGPKGMNLISSELNINWIGIDGDPNIDKIIIHDFSVSSYYPKSQYDLAWSVEFLEHVEEKYISNYMPCFQACKYVICTAAPPGSGGHHHVNEQTTEYWKIIFSNYGFIFDLDITTKVKEVSKMMAFENGILKQPNKKRDFMKDTGMFFRKDSL